MKRLLLLFIPLVFFFSCEKDNPNAIADSNNNEDCNCGEVVDIDYYPAFAGDYVIDVDDADGDGSITDAIVVGDHPDYSIRNVQMNCSGEMISICNELEMGELFCFDYVGDCYFAECTWGPMTYFDVMTDSFITEEMLLQSITNEDGYLVTPNSQLLPYNCE